MDFEEYSKLAMQTKGKGGDLVLGAIGLTGEAGEVADLIKKVIYHGHDIPTAKLAEELGDVLWYLAYLADAAHIPFGFVAANNLLKLAERYPDGFSEERSRNR
jgi:NTP pyrophosphatase (non-canonical NTP hydrolase)